MDAIRDYAPDHIRISPELVADFTAEIEEAGLTITVEPGDHNIAEYYRNGVLVGRQIGVSGAPLSGRLLRLNG